tara:strand:+ start:903 stop:1295 length:393 start_codon:yes stop_codon:yes gene_type:complete
MIGLDTTAVIDLFKKDSKIKELIGSLNENICSTVINYQELMFGLNAEDSAHLVEESFYDSFFDGIFLFLLDKESAKKSREILWNLRRNGKNIGKSDCSIAGIFLVNGVTKIITRNVKHFEQIPGLKVISY